MITYAFLLRSNPYKNGVESFDSTTFSNDLITHTHTHTHTHTYISIMITDYFHQKLCNLK